MWGREPADVGRFCRPGRRRIGTFPGQSPTSPDLAVLSLPLKILNSDCLSERSGCAAALPWRSTEGRPMITHITRLVAPCVAISLALGVNIAHAFDFVWVNAAMTGKWTARSNWQPYPSPPHVPGAGDTATFIGVYFSPTVEVPDGTSLNRMELDYDAVVDLNISGSMDV